MPLSQQVQEYCRRLRQNDPSLTEIPLWNQRIGDEDALALAQALPNNTFLKKLNLYGNITDVGASGFANALKINNTLQELCLGANQITDKGAIDLTETLKINKTLQTLWLGANQIADVGASGFANALKINQTLQTLYLAFNQITDVGGTNLAQALKTNKKLQTLNLGYNQIGDQGATELANALIIDKTLQTLNLDGNQITDKGATELANALIINKTLQVLSLDNNQITDMGASGFANVLKINNTLQTLILGNNEITDKGATDLAEALKTNTTLQTLSLGGNEIADKGATSLLEALQKRNGTVTFLNLDGNPNITHTITQQIQALVQQNRNGTRNPVPQPLPLPAPILFRNDALEQIRLLVAKTPNGQAVSIVPLLQEAAAHYMSDFWQLKYLYTAVNVYYKLGAISTADRTTLIQDMLATAKEWCRTPFEMALYRITLEHARQQGTINDLQRIWLEEQGRLVQISNADFICHIRQLIQQNTDRLDRVEHIQQAMCDAMVRLQNHVQQLDHNVQMMSRNVQQLSQQMQTMAVAINQVQDNVERVAASYSSFIASYRTKKRIEAGCDVLAAIMNVCSFGAAGNVFKGVVGFTLGSVVDLSDLQHIRNVVESIQTSVVVVEQNDGISSGHDNSDCSDGLTVLESFEKGLELAKENLADRKLEEAISKKNAVVLLSASVAVFSQAWEIEDNDNHQEEEQQEQEEPPGSTLNTTIASEESTVDTSGGQGPSSSSQETFLQQQPQLSVSQDEGSKMSGCSRHTRHWRKPLHRYLLCLSVCLVVVILLEERVSRWLCLHTTPITLEEETTTTNLPIADRSSLPSQETFLQQEPQQSTAETTATTQEETAAPAVFLSMMERVERLETSLGVPASETNGKTKMQRIGICEIYQGTSVQGTPAVKLLHLEQDMGFA